MFIYQVMEGKEVAYNFHIAMNIVEDIYRIDEPIIVKFMYDLRKPDETKVRGGCGWTLLQLKKGGHRLTHVIVIDSECTLVEAATVLIHEYAHLLSQQDHGFLMYELWREYLREEFKRRWDNAIGKEDWEADRGRTFMVGEVCGNREDKHLQE